MSKKNNTELSAFKIMPNSDNNKMLISTKDTVLMRCNRYFSLDFSAGPVYFPNDIIIIIIMSWIDLKNNKNKKLQ